MVLFGNMDCLYGFPDTNQHSCSNINILPTEGAKQFYKMGSMMDDSPQSDDLEAICSILEDETNKNQLAGDFILSLLKM